MSPVNLYLSLSIYHLILFLSLSLSFSLIHSLTPPLSLIHSLDLYPILTGRVGGGQVCRPHFPSPLHPWISDASKAMVPHPVHHSASSAWASPFSTKQGVAAVGPGMGPHVGPGVGGGGGGGPHSGHHLFTFPPTPPKDATPDIVSNSNNNTSSNSLSSTANNNNSGSNSHSHHQGCNNSAAEPFSLSQSDGLESKGYPSHMLSSWGSSLSSSNCGSSIINNGNKPREGTVNGNTSSAFASSSVQSPNPYTHHHHPSSHHHHFVPPPSSGGHSTTSSSVDHFVGVNGVSTYGFGSTHSAHSHSSPFHNHSLSKSVQSSNNGSTSSGNKPRSKARSSAGKRDTIRSPS